MVICFQAFICTCFAVSEFCFVNPGFLIGLSDPFCTLYVTTKESSKRTRVIEKTLNPKWDETFKL